MGNQTTIIYNSQDISAEGFSVTVRRGRSRDTDEFTPASGRLLLRNHNRNFDPSFFTTPAYLLMESGDYLLLENGDRIVLEQGSEASGDFGTINLGGDIDIRDGAVTVFAGHIEDTANIYDVSKRYEAAFDLGDLLTSLASTELQNEWQTTDGQLSGARLLELLDDVDLNGSEGTFNDGVIPLQGDTVSVGTNVLTYAQTVARTENGKLWVDRQGFLQYRGRYSFPSTSAAADFDDTDTNYQFNGAGVSVGSELRAWAVTVQRAGGEPQTANASSFPSKFGRRGVTYTGLLFRGDMFSESLAEHLVDKLSDPEAVISSLVVTLSGLSTADRAVVAALDINDTVTLSWTPTGTGSTITQTLVVEGVTYTADSSGFAQMVFQLSQFPDTNYFTLDTDRLDGGVPLGF